MYTANFPEDSVLSRHFESTAELKRQLWLQIPPSDSVLRRHYDSMNNPVESPPVSSPTAIPQTATVSTAPSEGKDFFTWLRGLFS
ncbi:MAG: hypothetical protein GY792_22440 [Gammaproteobacteria bacterium]|nr:hypothetical protein [Gammaproteobacteria bacterium]